MQTCVQNIYMDSDGNIYIFRVAFLGIFNVRNETKPRSNDIKRNEIKRNPANWNEICKHANWETKGNTAIQTKRNFRVGVCFSLYRCPVNRKVLVLQG